MNKTPEKTAQETPRGQRGVTSKCRPLAGVAEHKQHSTVQARVLRKQHPQRPTIAQPELVATKPTEAQ
jgi:hypothetical protein